MLFHSRIVASEYADKFSVLCNYSGIKDAVCSGDLISLYYRVAAVTPYDVIASFGAVFPGYIWQIVSDYHFFTFLYLRFYLLTTAVLVFLPASAGARVVTSYFFGFYYRC